MENLTQNNGLVKPDVPPNPLAGYNVVIYEKMRNGLKFKTILKPSDKPLRNIFSFFSGNSNYKCFAVRIDKKLKFDAIEKKMILAAQQHHVSLKCTVYYHVIDSMLIASKFETDPLMRLKEEIIGRIKKNVLESTIQFSDIHNYNKNIVSKALPNITLNQLRDFAEEELGIVIEEIIPTFNLPEELKRQLDEYMKQREKLTLNGELETIKDEYLLKSAETKRKIDIKYTDNQEQVKNLKSIHQFQRNILNGVESLIQETDLTNITPEELMRNIQTHINAAKFVNKGMEGQTAALGLNRSHTNDANRPSLSEGNTQYGNTDSFSELRQYLMDLQDQVENAFTDEEKKNLMLSYINDLLEQLKPGVIPDADIIGNLADKVNQNIDVFTRFLSHDVLKRERKFKDGVREIINNRKNPHKTHVD